MDKNIALFVVNLVTYLGGRERNSQKKNENSQVSFAAEGPEGSAAASLSAACKFDPCYSYRAHIGVAPTARALSKLHAHQVQYPKCGTLLGWGGYLLC